MVKYRIDGKDDDGNIISVYDTETGWSIPAKEDNRHYWQYLAWVAEGNEPDPME